MDTRPLETPATGQFEGAAGLSVRPAALRDIEGLWACSERAIRSSTNLPPLELPYWLQYLMDQIALGLVAVVERHGEIVGLMVLGYATWPWCRPGNPAGTYLVNQAWFVDKGARRGGSAMKLLDWAKRIADEHEMPLMIEIATVDGDVAEHKDTFVKRAGFGYIGGKLLYRP